MAKKKSKKKSTTKKATKPLKASKEQLCVFAFRLTPAERNSIHKTAGPGKASRFVRAVAVAFGNKDEAAFRAAVKQAREARQYAEQQSAPPRNLRSTRHDSIDVCHWTSVKALESRLLTPLQLRATSRRPREIRRPGSPLHSFTQHRRVEEDGGAA